MAESVWESGKLTDVWYPVGRSDSGNLRLRRANWDILLWTAPGASSPDTYVVPFGGDRFTSPDVGLRTSDWQIGTEFGYYGTDSVQIEPHETGGIDSIQSLHNFGYV